MIHTTPVAKKARAAKKSRATLLRLYNEGKLKGAETKQAAALIAEEKALQAFQSEGVSEDEPEARDALTLAEARHVIRVRGDSDPVGGRCEAAQCV